jgi:hypothetical protein
MNKISGMLVLVLVSLLIAYPTLAGMSSSAQLIPSRKVSLLSEGKETRQFQTQMPMPQGVMLLCNGSCLVQMQSLQLVAQDKAVFGLIEANESWDLTIKNGRIDFAIRPESKPMTFHTPGDLLQVERVILPAGSNGLVRGYISVTEQKTELVAEEGALQIAGTDGSQLVQPGSPIVLAQGTLPPNPSPGREVAPGTVAGTAPAFFSTTTMVVGGVIVADAIMAAVFAHHEAGEPSSPF